MKEKKFKKEELDLANAKTKALKIKLIASFSIVTIVVIVVALISYFLCIS